jgi:hypothetical protein
MTVAEITERKPRTTKPANDEPLHFASLYEALRAAQESLPDVAKNRTAKVKGKTKAGADFEYSYKYADITDVLSAVRPHFARHGLTILQPTRIDGGSLQVATRIVHDTTGQFEESLYPVAAIGADHQALGSALTYARRYALCSMIGLAPDEDADGQHAASSGPAGGERRPQRDPQPRQQSSAAAKREDAWGRFTRTLEGFTDINALEEWWADGTTQAKIEMMPAAWQEQAAEAYEKKQEALLSAGAPK